MAHEEPAPPAITCRVRSRSMPDRKSTRLNSSHVRISYAVFCLKKKKLMANLPFYINTTDEAASNAQIAAGTHICRQAHLREHAQIGKTCNIGKCVFFF